MTSPRRWPAERRCYQDPVTGVTVTQLTDYKGHSHHLYFTNPGWYAAGRKLLFGSDRENRTNLFGVDLESGEIEQLTEVETAPGMGETSFQNSYKNPVREEVYFIHARAVRALDLETREERALWSLPDGFVTSTLGVTADGMHVTLGVSEDMSGRFRVDLGRGYVGFEETWAARPLSRIVLLPVDGGTPHVVHEERYWVGHVNASPTKPTWITFCHEGPWYKVDNRIWALDLGGGPPRAIRPRTANEMVGHEYWHADGLHLGYHGWADATDYLEHRPGARFFGRIRFEGTDALEVAFPYETGHVHSNDFSSIVGDGMGGRNVVRLWKWNRTSFDEPRVLCEHRSSFHIQKVHVHPRFSPDGRSVLFTSDRSGYGNLYYVPVPDLAALPLLSEEG